MAKRHKDDTATFEELIFSDQAKAINAQILNLEASIKANIRRAHKEEKENPKEKRIKNLEDLINRLKEFDV